MTLSASTIWFVVYLMVVHWIGDFLLQSHRMSVGKSKDWLILSQHVLVYTGTLLAGVTLWLLRHGPEPGSAPSEVWVLWVVVNGGLHFWVDAVTSRWTRRLWNRWIGLVAILDVGESEGPVDATHWAILRGTPHNFFVVIGLDQWLLHGPMLLMTAVVFGL